MKVFKAFRRIVYVGLLIFALWYLNSLKADPVASESLIRGFVRTYGQYAAMISAYVPISLTEIVVALIVVVVLLLLVAFLVNLFKGRGVRAINNLLLGGMFVLIPVVLYVFSCQLSYGRDPIPLPFYETAVDSSEFVDIYNYYADDLNAVIAQLEFEDDGELKGEVDFDALAQDVYEAHTLADDDYYHPYKSNIKTMFSSVVFRELQITGVSFAPLGEANINTLNTKIGLPFTMAHEVAHGRGVMREDDANQMAFYVCLSSASPHLRYSAYVAYFYQLEAMVSETYISAIERDNLHAIDPIFNLSRNYVNSYWQGHQLLKDIGDFFNDLYLQTSGIEEGTDSYGGGTEIETDPNTQELIPSLYQKLFFEKYYRV
ncbi:MAG: DUF3810 domain-containing protein [Erysipelotrichia bacterium]|nr:DUF3810 domain-containing protein [Erysipelotrichia bacterium]